MFWPLIIPSVLWFLPHATAGFICIFLSLIYWRFCHWNWPELQPGVYCHAGPKAQAIFHKAAPLWKAFRNYRAPFWLFSGDWTTTWPFVFFEPIAVEYSRKWVQNSEDRGLVALDVAFPPQGFDPAAPVLVLLHGLNGGSNESYVTSCVAMAQAKGWTVVVYIARGLDGTPLTSKTGTGFHGARLGDFHAVLTALANALPSGTPLVAGGWSMGAIVLAQYVCATPEQLQGSTPVKLGAAVCVC